MDLQRSSERTSNSIDKFPAFFANMKVSMEALAHEYMKKSGALWETQGEIICINMQ